MRIEPSLMPKGEPPSTNFAPLQAHDAQLVRLGMLAERYFAEDPNTSLLKVRQFAELLAQSVAARVGLFSSTEEAQYDLLRRLQDDGVLPREIAQLFGEIRRIGNAASHGLRGDHASALATLKLAWQAGVWFHRTFGDPQFRSGAFIPPAHPRDESAELRAELNSLRAALDEHRAAHADASQRAESSEASLRAVTDERSFWEQTAAEAEVEKVKLQQRLAELQSEAATRPASQRSSIVNASNLAATQVELDEHATRLIVDAQLRQAGWEADTDRMTFSKGTRPEKGRNLAIAEWPTAAGPADYVLFLGLEPVAAIEAKRRNKNVSAALQQSARYSTGFDPTLATMTPSGQWGNYKLPLLFSTNARPFLRQLHTHSGVWFRDARRSTNLARALDGWYTPEGVKALLKRNEDKAEADLRESGYEFGFQLRPYQINAIRAVETAIESGRRDMLVAMATGTGKTKTCIALVYRLLKAQRFRRVLFLVDRSALGDQAIDAFKDTRMERLQTFADIFGIKELDEQQPDSETAVHIATVQGMVQRLLYCQDDEAKPPVDQYDCIVVDECHRGYLLDRELSDTEMSFRGFAEYISKYRRVLDYFDAVKIGLTATPALHTTQIFGKPVFSYSYREAVIDGYLIDHEPPLQIATELSQAGIVWRAGEQVQTLDTATGQIDLFTTPDEIKVEVEQFNKGVVTKAFNEVVCGVLAKEIDPSSRQKTLIFCATDSHADLVVDLLKRAFRDQYGEVEDDAVLKITGAADKPLGLIRRYKNERNPTVAVTVDLLTTGVDVPEICNLIFLRRVNSRILFEQMLGRATRLCPEVQKESFRIFDPVRLYEALESLTAMKPVVVNPSISFSQIVGELAARPSEDAQALLRDQLIAKFHRKKRHLGERAVQDFEVAAGVPIDQFANAIRALPIDEVADWFIRHPGIGEVLDRDGVPSGTPLLISEHPDQLVSVSRGYGKATKPDDYLSEFAQFILDHKDEIPGLLAVVTRPRDLTRKHLRVILYELDKAGFSERSLATAWREKTNQEIAARIVGYIRQAALGETLMPYGERVERALAAILASRPWTAPQRRWLQTIASQTKADVIVDRETFDDPDLVFKREGGGFARLDRIFDNGLEGILATFNDSIWRPAA
jgi:type I restriction enzyme R subunit